MLLKVYRKIRSFLKEEPEQRRLRRQILLKKRSDEKDRGVVFYDNVNIDLESVFEGGNAFYENCSFYKSYVGYGTYIARNSSLDQVKFGRFCSVGPYFEVIAGKHPTREFISTHPAFYSTQKQAGFSFVDKDRFKETVFANKGYLVEVGSDVFIGAKVTVLDGVKIGHGAIIAAGSVVYKDIEPYAVYAGSPLRLIRYRFPQEIIDKLLMMEWWNRPLDWIKDHAMYFDSPQNFFDHEQ